MNAKLIFALVLAFALAACNGTVPPVTAEPTEVSPTEVPPTAVPSATPTQVPTATPTEVPTPTATPDPATVIVWEIAQTMVAECAGSNSLSSTVPLDFDRIFSYSSQLQVRAVRKHPELLGETRFAHLVTSNYVLANDGSNPNPFADLDYTTDGVFIRVADEGPCEAYEILIQDDPENFDGDGVLVGRARLFYEVGGTQPYMLDGELREVRFTFPPVPDQEAAAAARATARATEMLPYLLPEAVLATASRDCLAVVPTGQSEEEIRSWLEQYPDTLWERLGDDFFRDLQLDSVFSAECVVLLFRNTTSGQEFLIYETAGGVVKVPFEIPSVP